MDFEFERFSESIYRYTFTPNANNDIYTDIDHIDGNPSNNTKENIILKQDCQYSLKMHIHI